jgi:hypothetical protein
MNFTKGQRVVSKLEGQARRFGTVAEPVGATPNRVYVRWDGNVLSNGYPLGGDVAESLRPTLGPATPVMIAESFAETMKNSIEFDAGGALEEDGDSDLSITEVADIDDVETSANGLTAQFTVKTSDGLEWTVRVTPKA